MVGNEYEYFTDLLIFVDSSKTQKSNYLENETIFFVQVKNTLIIHYGLYHGKNSFPEDVTFNIWDE